jgi:integrase
VERESRRFRPDDSQTGGSRGGEEPMACVKRRRGRWVVDFRDDDGKRRWESYRTRDEADTALEKRLGELRQGTYRPPAETPTFRTVAEAWLEGRRAMGLRTSTIVGWETHLQVHLLPTFGDTKLDQIGVIDVEKFRDERRLRGWAGKPLAAKTVNKLLVTMSAVFSFAARRHLIDRNPAKLAERFTRHNGQRIGDEVVQPDQVLSPEEAARVIEKAEPGFYQTLFLTAYLTGARVGELTGLFWSDIDLTAKTLRIERSVSWAKPRGTKERRKPALTEPKSSSSKRTLSIPGELVSALRRWKLACPPSELGLVFPSAEGTPKHRSTISHEGLQPALAAAEITKRVSMHTFRHSFATYLITAGTPVNVVAKKLGHEKPDVTLRTYTHWFSDGDDSGVDALARLVCGDEASMVAKR